MLDMALTTVSSLSESFTSGIPVAAEVESNNKDDGAAEPKDKSSTGDDGSENDNNGNPSSRIEEVPGVGNEEGETEKDGATVGSGAAVVAMDTTEDPPKEGESEPTSTPPSASTSDNQAGQTASSAPDATMTDAETTQTRQPKKRRQPSDSDGGTDSDEGADLEVHD